MNSKDYVRDGLAALEQCEAALRSILSDAAGAGEYAAVLRLTSVGQSLGELLRRLRGTEAGPGDDVHGGLLKTADPNRRARAKRESHYPRFLRRGDDLVKIGWSKRGRGEYTHRTPWPVVAALTRQLDALLDMDKPTPSDAFLPLAAPERGDELPTYQVYIALAWLLAEGLVQRHGRQGYTLCSGEELASRAQAAWSRLTAG